MSATSSDQYLFMVAPATPVRWEDIEELFVRTACWCQYWRLPAAE